MTSIAARLIGAKRGYWCPDDNGLVYVIFTSIRFVQPGEELAAESSSVECDEHGSGYATYAREHFIANPAQKWFSGEATEENKWPDAWCAACNVFFEEEGEWNDKNEGKMKIKLLCHHCYERLRSQEKI